MRMNLSGKELYSRFTVRAFRKLLSSYVFTYFSFGFEGRIWDLIVSVPDHCLSFYFGGPARSVRCAVRLLLRRSQVRSSGPAPPFVKNLVMK